jgi:hypothetical protein
MAKRLDSTAVRRYGVGTWHHPSGGRATGTAPAMRFTLSSLLFPLFDVSA